MADEKNPPAISAISIKGFKSFLDEQRIEIRPLTVLAGANSSGKSSALQPLLLLKQTLEAPFDPGPLLLDGPHVRFTAPSQFFSRKGRRTVNSFSVLIEKNGDQSVRNVFKKVGDFGVDLVKTEIASGDHPITLTAEITRDEETEIFRDRCFFDFSYPSEKGKFLVRGSVLNVYRNLILSIIHVPGFREQPARSYRTAAVRDRFPGTFDNYFASLILSWQLAQDPRLEQLNSWLQELGLTSQVRSRPIDATQIELLVSRLPIESDLVNLADVGFGVSQILPVLVALLAAKPGQLVYLEEPDLWLHPRVQQAMATVLADAANRGVRVVVETHSSILLLAVRALVVEGKIAPERVMLNWFQRDDGGATKVTNGEIDEIGAYGDWPEDFGEVQAALDNRYLDAVESKVFPPKKRGKG